MTHSFARSPDSIAAERRESRRRWLIAGAILLVLAAGFFAWTRLGSHVRPTPQPKEPRRISVLGDDRLVSMSLWRGITMSGSPPFTVVVCADGTIVCDLEKWRGDRWEVSRRMTGRATPERIGRLEAAFARASFTDLRTTFDRRDRTCHPYYEIYRLENDRPKLVRYYGGDTSAPQELALLVGEFWDALDLDRWVPIGGAALRAESAESR